MMNKIKKVLDWFMLSGKRDSEICYLGSGVKIYTNFKTGVTEITLPHYQDLKSARLINVIEDHRRIFEEEKSLKRINYK